MYIKIGFLSAALRSVALLDVTFLVVIVQIFVLIFVSIFIVLHVFDKVGQLLLWKEFLIILATFEWFRVYYKLTQEFKNPLFFEKFFSKFNSSGSWIIAKLVSDVGNSAEQKTVRQLSRYFIQQKVFHFIFEKSIYLASAFWWKFPSFTFLLHISNIF